MWDLPGVSTIHCSSGPAYLRGFDGVGLEMGWGCICFLWDGCGDLMVYFAHRNSCFG
jgi:hypothetical protein